MLNDASAVGGGIPMMTALPPQSRTSTALRRTAGWPTQSNDHMTPLRVRSLTACTTSVSPLASTKSVAPNWRAWGSLAATVSTAMMRPAPAMRAPWMALRPTPPTPNTATGSPCWILARLRAAPAPVRTPQPTRQAELSGTSSGMRMACTSFTTVYSAKYEEPAKFQAGSPSTVKGWLMLPSDLRHQVGWPVLQALQMPQLARVVRTTCWPGFTEVTSGPTSATIPAPSCPRTDGAGQGMVPSSTLTSLWHRPALVTWTFTSPGPGSRTSTPSDTAALAPSNTMALTKLMLRQEFVGRFAGIGHAVRRPSCADPTALYLSGAPAFGARSENEPIRSTAGVRIVPE